MNLNDPSNHIRTGELLMNLASSLMQDGDAENANAIYLHAIRHGLIVRHIKEKGSISESELNQILSCNIDTLYQLFAEEETLGGLAQRVASEA